MRTRPLIVVAIETKPQMLTRSNAGNERNFASALLSTNEISKCSTKLRNTQRNFETLNETSLENSLHQTKYRSKFRAMFRAITRNFEHVKTIALRNFFEISFPSKFSPIFVEIRRNSLLLLGSSANALLLSIQYTYLLTGEVGGGGGGGKLNALASNIPPFLMRH